MVAVGALWAALLTAAVAVVVVRWRIDPYSQGGSPSFALQRSVYRAETTWLIALLAISGLIGLAIERARAACTLLCGGFALGLAGTGVVAVRRWNTSKGFAAEAGNLAELRVLAAVLALVAGACAVACLVAVVTARRPEVDTGAVVQVLAGLAMIVAVPLAMGWEFRSTRTTQFGAHALMYGIPWAATLIADAFTPTLRRVALAGPLLAGPFLVLGRPMIPGNDVGAGYVVAVGIVAVCLVAQSVADHRHADLTPATPAS